MGNSNAELGTSNITAGVGTVICDLFWENVPKVKKTTMEIQLKVGNNSIFNKKKSKTYILLISLCMKFKAFGSPCASGKQLKHSLLL